MHVSECGEQRKMFAANPLELSPCVFCAICLVKVFLAKMGKGGEFIRWKNELFVVIIKNFCRFPSISVKHSKFWKRVF